MGVTGGPTPANGRTRPPSGRRYVMLARVAALMVLIAYVAGIAANVWLDRLIAPSGDNPVEDAMVVVGFGMFAGVGALLVARRPGNPIGWILSVASLVVLASALETYAAYVMTTRGRPDWLATVGVWANSWYWLLLLGLILVYLPLLFPDGRLPSRRWLPVAVVPGIALATTVVLGALVDTLSGQDIDYQIENPIGIEGLAHVEDMPLVLGVLGVPFLVGCVGGVVAVAVRLRRSGGVERQQMKWFLYAAAPIPTFPITDYLPDVVSGVLFGWIIIGLPTAIGIAVLRYRLYDIDVVINRTLVYGTLTASLVAVYLGSVVGLQRLFTPLTGEGNQLSVVASTLLIAALFGPLRKRVQGFIDRRFYRKKYDAQKTLESFSAKLRGASDLDGLNEELLAVVGETVQPQHASMWLRGPERETPR